MAQYPDKSRGPTPRTPGFAETVVTPFFNSLRKKAETDLENKALDKRTIVQALINMSKLGVPDPSKPNAPGMDFAGMRLPYNNAPDADAMYKAAQTRALDPNAPLSQKDIWSGVTRNWDPYGATGNVGGKTLADMFQKTKEGLQVQYYTEEDIAADMKKLKMTREQILAKYAEMGARPDPSVARVK